VRGQNQSGVDNDIAMAVLSIILLLLIIFAAYMFPEPFSWVWHWTTFLEIKILGVLSFALPQHVVETLGVLEVALNRYTAGSLGWEQIFLAEKALFPYNGAIYFFIIFLMALYIKYWAAPHHQRHTTETLIAHLTQYYRYSRMFVKYNPLKDSKGDITKGPFRLSDSIEGFSRKNQLLTIVVGEENRYGFEKAKSVFRKQLGLPFTGIGALKQREKRLVAAMLLRADKKKAASDELLGDISYFYNDEIDEDYIDDETKKILASYQDHEIVKDLTRNHAYVYTFILGLFQRANACGKFTSGYFPWVILEDRTLYFALNDLGRPGGSTEGFAPSVHYLAEQALGHAKVEPTDELSATSFKQKLIDMGLIPEENDSFYLDSASL